MSRYNGYRRRYKKIEENIGFLEKSWQELDMGYTTPCWLWNGEITKDWYGIVTIGCMSDLAHRYSYEHYIDKIPDELEIDHLCHMRRCINPEHFELVTRSENCKRKQKRNEINPETELFTCTNCYKFVRIINNKIPIEMFAWFICDECKKKVSKNG